MTEAKIDDATAKFRQGIHLAAENMTTDALVAFGEVVERWPDHELADDALFNVGACYLALNQFGRAASSFERLLSAYPDATIASDENGGTETGRTAAKAYLGLVSAHLGKGDLAGARAACAKLEDYGDSKLHPAPGVERTYHDVAESLLAAAEGHEEEDADEIRPEDCSDTAEASDD